MNKIRPQEEDISENRTTENAVDNNIPNVTYTFSEHEVDIDSTVAKLKSI